MKKTFEKIHYENEYKSEKIKKIDKIKLPIPNLETLRNIDITPKLIKELKHTPIDITSVNRGKNYRNEYKKLFKEADPKVIELLKETKDYGILGENYYYKR
jgi:phosphoglucomutase